ncbi:MAG TPA: hypothetical protein VMZ71_09125 [Gemmataceae bacterium]|nr:hypothetical protein [Gemmataceae bacterium]
MRPGTRVISVHPNPVGTHMTGTVVPDPAPIPWPDFYFVRWDNGSSFWTNRALRAMCRCCCTSCEPPATPATPAGWVAYVPSCGGVG